eukprot:4470145-Pyramimonas_sp.AAC.2
MGCPCGALLSVRARVGSGVSQGGLCVVGFFNAAAVVAGHVQTLKDVAVKRAGQPFTFTWCAARPLGLATRQ